MRPVDTQEPSLLDRIGRRPLVGRRRELAEALVELHHALEGEGRALIISGEPGVGKTRFARELMAQMQAEGGTALSGACYAEGDVPYAPMARMIRESLIRVDALELPETVLAGLAALLPASHERYANLPANLSIDTRLEQQRLFESVAAWCVALSARAPLLLSVDDIQWADSATLFLLRHLARSSRELPLLLVLSLREPEPEEASDLANVLLDLNRERLATQLTLGRLGRAATGELLAAMFAEAIPPEFLEGIYEQTEGNPFFIEEVCKALIEEGKLAYRDGRWHPPSMAELKIPHTVRAAIQSRVAKLSQPARDTLRLAAIVGREFDFETLLRAGDLDETTLIGALESALRAQLIAEVDAGGQSGPAFSFVHALISTTLRESTIHLRRRLLHRRVAQALEAVRPNDFEALAYHYAESGETGRVHEFYTKAGDRAQACAPDDAARLYRAALEYLPLAGASERASTLAKLGGCLWVIADHEGALQCYEAAYHLYDGLGDRLHAGDMQRLIGRIYWVQADPPAALQHYHRALAMLEEGPETVELARAISSISQMHMLAPVPNEAIAWGERALAMAERLGAEDVIVHAMNNIGTSLALSGEYEKGLPLLQASAQRALAMGAPEDACRAYYNLGVELQRECRYAAARDWLEQLQAYAAKIYARNYVTLARWRLMWLYWLTGRWSTALAHRGQLMDLGSGLYSTWTDRVVATMDIDMGRIKEARDSLEERLPSALQAADMQTTLPHMGEMVRAYALAGQDAKASEAAGWVLSTLAQLPYPVAECIMPLFFSCQWLAEQATRHALEQARTCAAHLERLDERLRTEESRAALAEARACLLLADGRAHTSAEHLRKAADAWATIERRYDQVRSLQSLGRALDLASDWARARVAWAEALEIVESLAAQLDDEQRASFLASSLVHQVRQAMGVPPKTAGPGGPGTGGPGDAWAGLTEREIEVLRLVARGMTNGQIAEKLVLSPLTVNAHLRSIFNKLDVTRRTAAARLAIEHGLV